MPNQLRREIGMTKALLFISAFSVLTIWYVESQTALIAPLDRWALPILGLTFISLAALSHWHPRMLSVVRRAMFWTVGIYFLIALLLQIHLRPSLEESYQLANNLQWSTVIYVAAFVFLGRKEAVISSLAVYFLLIALSVVFWLLPYPRPWDRETMMLVFNMFGIHLLLILTLSVVGRLKDNYKAEKRRADLLERFRQQDHILHMAVTNTGIGIWSVEFPSRKVTWSDRVYELHEVPENFVPTWENTGEFFSQPERQELGQAFENCIQHDAHIHKEIQITTFLGNTRWVQIDGESERNEMYELTRVCGTIQDITSAKLALKQEQELARAAQAAERAQAAFLAVMSHEIRTPMNAILGFTDILAKDMNDPTQREHVDIIQQSGQSLLRIIDDILDYSRIEAGQLKLEEIVFSPVDQVRSVCHLLNALCQHKAVKLIPEIEEGLPGQIIGDALRLRQVLINLTSNAIKFTDRGEVRVALQQGPTRRDGSPQLKFTVMDTGVGIPEEKLEQIFRPFMQADASSQRKYGGTGLGLTISRSLVEIMGGQISVKSKVGKGSLFTILLPYSLPKLEDQLVPSLPIRLEDDSQFASVHPLRILVAEDDNVNRRLACKMLERLGYSPFYASDGHRAVEIFAEEKPDCVLMDLHMPGLDGLDAARKLREICPEHRVFISALTADVLSRKEVLTVMDDFLTKPVKVDALKQILAQAHAYTTRVV